MWWKILKPLLNGVVIGFVLIMLLILVLRQVF